MARPGRPRTSAFHQHMRERWRAFQRGMMRSGERRTGPVVRSVPQFVAIALAEARSKRLRGTPRRRR